MKRHKAKDSSGKNKIFYIHVSNIHTPLQTVEDSYSVEGPDSKEDFEDFRYSNWDDQIMEVGSESIEEDALIALTRHEAERLHARLERMLSE